MKILTLNTWNIQGPWRERWEVIFNEVRPLVPDILGCQELFDGAWAEEARKYLGYRYLAFPRQYAGLVMMSNHEVLEWDCYQMKTQSRTEDYKRYVLYAKLRIRKDELNVFNTHLSWKPEEDGVRFSQIQELLDYMDQKSKGHATVVMGDFNAAPETREVKQMTEKGYADLYAKRHPGEAGFTWDNRNLYASSSSVKLPDRRIDFIFTKNEKDVLGDLKSVEIILKEPNARGVFGSDHSGVFSVFEMKGKGSGE
ncbi:MAG: endonuclease/exonuclease/phosphatase family protein [Candidatus Omnitrophica bacterium]|nr:endonuclease/exonuclease/phosphatase family protein [Candidatus Omnitrophota bacterium]